tara:strand:- start:535 stop:741 length:207 start_codon:yes stop_codon:yes gene_type:complete
MTKLKKYYENKKGYWVKILKTKIYNDPMYLLEWENKNESSYDENFYTYYNHALLDFDYMIKKNEDENK